ncbi:MAG: hypothetical protein R3B36_02180 [Polyangiaceae bacterium]
MLAPTSFRAYACAIALLSTLAAGDVACTSDGGGPQCAAYVVPAGTDLTQPATQLRRDVLPILNRSCAFSSCHGSASGRNQGVFLGNDAARVRLEMSAVTQHNKSATYVVPGDPSKSFLMHKIDGDQCTLDSACEKGSCGDSMPLGNPLLPVSDRDVIRRWIAQGAKDD